MDFLPKVEDNIIEDEPTSDEEPIEPIKSTQITEEDIFNPKPKLVIKEVIEEPIEDEPILHDIAEQKEDIGGLDVEVVEPVKQPKTQVKTKKKRVLSEAHKQKLAQARVKALETRRENARIRKEKKELEKAIKDKELEALREKAGIRKPKKVTVNVKPVVQEVKEEPQPVFDMKQSYTKEDIEKASLNAIMGYEKIRKQRKAKKREEQEKNKHEIQLKKELTQRIMPQTNSNVMYGQSGYWDNCF